MPPYHEHLVRDAGAAPLPSVPLLVLAVWRRSRDLAKLGLCSVVAFTAPHTAFHMRHGSRVRLDAALAGSVAVSTLLVVAARESILSARPSSSISA